MEITEEDMREMGEYLGEINNPAASSGVLNPSLTIKEPRRTAYGNIRHKLIDIIVIGFTTVLCGSDEFEEMPATELPRSSGD